MVVSIDSLAVARLAVITLAGRLRDRGLAVSLVNESGTALPDGTPDEVGEDGVDVVLVLAVLNPADGAEHLREWGSNVVAIVTAGRSTETKLTTNTTMLRTRRSTSVPSCSWAPTQPTRRLASLSTALPRPLGAAAAEERSHSTVESS